MAGYNKAPKALDQEGQLKDIRRQLSDHLGCLEFRLDSKLSLLAEFQEFFKRRGEVEYEYARSLERICEKFERNTKQRNLRNEVRSTFNLWSTLLAETRKMSRERASLAEVMASEMVARVDIMVKDVQMLAKRCKEVCVEIQDQFLKELRDLSEQTKVYQHSCNNTSEAYSKVSKSKEKMESIKGATVRRKKAEEKLIERQKQYKVQKHLLLKNRNDYLLGITRCNALSSQYFSMDIMDVIELMDYDYHDSFRRLFLAYQESDKETCEAVKQSGEMLVEQTKVLNFENDLHYFLSEYSGPFTAPSYFQFTPFGGDDVTTFKVNTEDVFKRWSKTSADLKEEIQTLQIQREEDIKTIQHIQQVNLKKYQVVSVDDALAVLEENGDTLGLDGSKERGTASLERGLPLTTRGGQAILQSQKGKKDTVYFTLQIAQRRILRADRLAVANAQLDILDRAFSEQKVPPVPVGVDAQGRAVPGEVPPLFGGELMKYILATGCEIPLIVESCVDVIEKHGMKMEGLFRVPGPAAVMEELRAAFEEGRDPLANYPQAKLDVAAVASTLKAYFRELSTPLFPTDKYQEFINCTRQEDLQSRLDALSATIHSLPPQVISVMAFLFRFLYRVSLHSADNKMGSPNLALVFGPTLTRAPDSLDPRQLHNDVPSVNILIQLCIDRHDYIFGEQCTTSTPEESSSLPLSTSPPTEPPSAPPVITDTSRSSPQELSGDFDDEVCELPPPPPRPPRTSGEISLPPDDAPAPPRPPKPEAMSPPPPPPEEQEPLEREPLGPEKRQASSEKSPSSEAPIQEVVSEEIKEEKKSQESSQRESKELESSTTSHTSGLDVSGLDATMQEIEDTLHDLSHSTASAAIEDEQKSRKEEEDDDDDDSDSEDEEGEDGLRIGARALYDYSARSDKELTFSRGDALQVITKTPDNNWWDGFHDGRRGYIPVAYVEITELKTIEEEVPMSPALAVPPPPQRKSSMPISESDSILKSSSESPTEPTITEEAEEEMEEESPSEPLSEVVSEETPSDDTETVSPTISVEKNQELETISKAEHEQVSKAANFPVKSVRSLTMQFQEPEEPQQRVLVEPHTTHRRLSSEHYKSGPPDVKEGGPPHPRSSSGGSKVSMLSSTFENKTSSAPPPIRPKPPVSIPSPSSPSHGASSEPGMFPLVQHGSSLPSVSPLQRAAHQSQHIGPKPAIPGKKPFPTAKVTAKPKGSVKVKKKDSLKDSKDKGGKPPPNPKPAGGFAATPAEIQAELQARAAKRKQND